MSEPRTRKIVLVAVVAAVAAAAWWQREALQRTWRRTIGPVPAPLILVMPIEAPAGDAGGNTFASGVTRDLMARLGQVPGVKVLGRSGAERLKASPLQTVAGIVDASAVLTGTVGRSGNEVRVDLELIAASDLASVWAGSFSGDVSDIVALESRAAGDVAAALGVRANPTASNARALTRKVNPGAYGLHARGQDALARLQPAEALDFFTQATAADASLAEAWAGIAESIRALDFNEGVPDDPERVARLRAAGARALELDPDSPQSQFAQGLAAPALNDALIALKTAIDIDPSFAPALEALGDAVRDIDPDRALAFYGRALVADPFLETTHIHNASTMLLLNRWGQTHGELLRITVEYAPPWSLAMFPVLDFAQDSLFNALADLMVKTPLLRERPYFLAQLVQTLAGSHKTAEAAKEGAALIERFPGDCEGRAAYAGVLADLSRVDEARAVAQPLFAAADGDKARGSTLRCAGAAAAALGDAAQTAAILERIYAREDWWRAWSFARFGQSGRLLLMGHTYPWTKVIDLPPVAALRGRIDTTTEEKRKALHQLLGPVAYQ